MSRATVTTVGLPLRQKYNGTPSLKHSKTRSARASGRRLVSSSSWMSERAGSKTRSRNSFGSARARPRTIRSLSGMRHPVAPCRRATVELERLLDCARSCRQHLVVALADDLAIHHLLLVPAADEAAVLEAGHQLVEGGTALPDPGRAQALAERATRGGPRRELGDHEELEMRELRQRHRRLM